MNSWARFACVLLVVVEAAACATMVPPSHEATSLKDPALADFYSRVEQSVALRERLRTHALVIQRQKTGGDVTLNQEIRDALAARIRQERATARQGDIFTNAIAVTVRGRLDPALRGGAATDARDTIRDEAPARFALRINDSYPAGAAVSTMPSTVLAVLPALPPGFEYRIVNAHLILRDTEANIIVDYLLSVMCQTC